MTSDNSSASFDPTAILEERGKNYGTPEANFKCAVTMMAAMYGARENNHDVILIYPMTMIAAKLARLASGNVEHLDSWQDIIGYAQLALDIIERRKK